MSPVKIIIADAEDASRQGLTECLRQEGYEVIEAKDGDSVLPLIKKAKVDVLLADLELPEFDTMRLLSTVKTENPDTSLLVMTGHASVTTAVETMKMGVVDYLAKPVDRNQLLNRMKKVVQSIDSPSRGEHIDRPKGNYRFEEIVGQCSLMKQVFKLVEKVADSDSTVLINGESGTGKELMARAIHYISHRRKNPLVPVNCGAIPEELLESELFGHEKGAFTGAHRTRIGRFEMADEGTVFLDEIGDMSPNLQVKILRVLQQHEIERVGGVKSIKVDIRVIAATHRDLEKLVAEGKFREDLFYRLNVIPLEIPALRQRKPDISLLVDHFMKHFNTLKGKSIAKITPVAMEYLINYHWPGNVRELQNLIERLVILKENDIIDVSDLPEKLLHDKSEKMIYPMPLSEEGTSFSTMVTDFEKQLILQALKKTSGVKNKAAKLLNMNRTTLVEKMKKLQIK